MSSHEMRISSAGRPLSPGAVAVMLMLCLSWGFNQIAVKLALPDIPPILQATIRSAGALWAATTLIVKAAPLLVAPAEKALGYQVAVSIPILALAAWLSGETLTRVPGTLALSLMAYQAIWVVGLTYLLWVALVKTYSASKLSAFTFITPLFGVVASYFIMHDALTLAFGAAALLVIAGLYLVNRPIPVGPVAIDPLLNVTKT